MRNTHFFTLTTKLLFILTTAFLCNQAMAREPYLNGGHFSALNNEWALDQRDTTQTEGNLSPADIAASNCDTLVYIKPVVRENQHEKTGAEKTNAP